MGHEGGRWPETECSWLYGSLQPQKGANPMPEQPETPEHERPVGADKDGLDDEERAAARAEQDRNKEQDEADNDVGPGLAEGDPNSP
jgi:hypothetical protein